ncbi:MAG: AAA family ATPase [Methanobacteriota archaeon]
MKIICITGMPGAGKNEVARFFEERGISIVRMGDVVREEAERRGCRITPENLGKISAGLREEFGEEEIARRCFEQIEKIKCDILVIEGIRSLEEVAFFRQKFGNIYTLAVHSSQKTRFSRLKKRGRGDDTKLWKEFEERDSRELGYGLGGAIALADFMLVNEGALEELREKVERVYERVKE